MSLLNGKVIKKAYMKRYVVPIEPEEYIDENGMERRDKEFRYFMVLDQNNYAYVIPAVNRNGNCVKAYEIEDIVEAANGNKEARTIIENIKRELRKDYCRSNMLDARWAQELYEGTLSIFLDAYNNSLQERNLPSKTMNDMPATVKTENNFTYEEIETVLFNAVIPE
ncbi:MAG: hypothetical protein K2I30_03965 [Clostridia bacterium]|nr:hypothetical protein [Clostridia bacterium]